MLLPMSQVSQVRPASSNQWNPFFSSLLKCGPSIAHVCPPPLTVDTAIFEMWLGNLSAHQGLAISVV